MVDVSPELARELSDALAEVGRLEGLVADAGVRYFNPHEKQACFIESCFANRESWAFCGNRGGKTEAGAVVTATMATGVYMNKVWGSRRDLDYGGWNFRAGGTHWVCSASNEVQREVTQPKLMRWLPKDSIEKVVNVARGVIDFIVLKTGNRIVFKQYEQDVDKFTGADVDSIWFDEEPPQDIYKESLMRTIDRGGHVFGTLTPVNGLTWIYNDVYEKADLRGIKIFNWDMDDNPFLSDKEKSAILAGLTDDERRIRKSGQFIALHGLVYPMFDEARHCIEPFMIPKHWRRVVAVDPHLKKPMAILWGALASEDFKGVKKGDWVIYQELIKGGAIPDVVAAIEVMNGRDRLYARVGDPVMNVKTDNFVGLDVFGEFASMGFPLLPANKNVSGGIMQIRELLAANPSQLWIFNNCINLIWQFKHYVYKDIGGDLTANYNEKIRKTDDDLLDCLRYMVNTGIKPGKMGGDAMSWQNVYSPTGRLMGFKPVYAD